MKQHCLLSPSAAHRWLQCPPSVRICEEIPRESSPFAEEGTLAHAVAALSLKAALGMDVTAEREEIAASALTVDETMERCAAEWAALITDRLAWWKLNCGHTEAYALVERRVALTAGGHEIFGTADAIIITDTAVEVYDYKYGLGVAVSAVENRQMMIYALGALCLSDGDPDEMTVRMTIFQPRIDNLSEWEAPAPVLLSWQSGELAEKAALAYDGKGELHCGAWCRFCAARPQCHHCAAEYRKAWEEHRSPHLLTIAQISELLHITGQIRQWAEAVEDHALARAMQGENYPGWKVVEGRGKRVITDAKGAAAALLEGGLAEAAIFKPRELQTITTLEALAGKKRFAQLCGNFIDKKPGNPKLAEDSDSRQPVNNNVFADLDTTNL